jgi:hypothetical protein
MWYNFWFWNISNTVGISIISNTRRENKLTILSIKYMQYLYNSYWYGGQYQDIQISQGSWSGQWKWYCSSRRSIPWPKSSLSILILPSMCLYQHPSLYHEIVKVTWRVFKQWNVCFLFWYAIFMFIWRARIWTGCSI